MTVSGGTFTVTPISQRLQVFANGLGYRYNEYQYAALLRETTSYTGTGDLAFKMRTGTSSNVVGMDITTTGVKIYGPVHTQIGYASSPSANTSYSMSDIKGYSFIEIVARFNTSGTEMVTMLMTRAAWAGTLSTMAAALSTDSRYVILYRYSDTMFRVLSLNGCYSITFYGIL